MRGIRSCESFRTIKTRTRDYTPFAPERYAILARDDVEEDYGSTTQTIPKSIQRCVNTAANAANGRGIDLWRISINVEAQIDAEVVITRTYLART